MITSQITGKPIFGQNPAGFTPLIPNNSGYLTFLGSKLIDKTFLYTALTFVPNDIPATQNNFLQMIKTEMDTNYLPSILTDSTKNYEVEIVVNNVRVDYSTPSTDRGIWTQRTYNWYVQLSINVNVN